MNDYSYIDKLVSSLKLDHLFHHAEKYLLPLSSKFSLWRVTGSQMLLAILLSSYFITVATIPLLIFIVAYIINRHHLNKLSKLPGPRGNPLFEWFSGNLGYGLLIKSVNKLSYAADWIIANAMVFQSYNLGLYRISAGPLYRAVVLFSADAIEPLLSNKQEIEKPFAYELFRPIFGNGVLSSKGRFWRKNRRRFNTTFHINYLEKYVPRMNEKIKILFTTIDKSIVENNGVIEDFSRVMTRCTFDIIFENAMGMPSNTQNEESSMYLSSFEQLFGILNHGILIPFRIKHILSKLTVGLRMHMFSAQIIRQKLKALKSELFENKNFDLNEKRENFLENLLLQHLKDPKELTFTEIRQDIDGFIFAGHDTTSMTSLFCLLFIGLHQNIQDKVYQELQEYYFYDNQREYTLEDSNKLKYLEQCIKETMRLYPAAPLIARHNESEFTVGKHVVPAHTSCIICLHQLHRDPKYFPNPEKFDPDRFTPENCAVRHPYAYAPFSLGIRNCVGMRYAMIEMKAILSSLLRKYRVISLTKRDEIKTDFAFIVKSATKIKIKFELR